MTPLSVAVRDYLSDVQRGIVIVRHLQGAAQGDDLRALKRLETQVMFAIEPYQATLSRAVAPWFEVAR